MRSLDGIIDWLDMSSSKFRELVMDREARRAAVHGVAKSWTRLSDWTEAVLWETQTTVQSKASKDTDSIVTFLRILKHIKNILVFSLCKGWFSPHPAQTYLIAHKRHLCCEDFCLPFASCPQSLGLRLALRAKLRVLPVQPLGILFSVRILKLDLSK